MTEEHRSLQLFGDMPVWPTTRCDGKHSIFNKIYIRIQGNKLSPSTRQDGFLTVAHRQYTLRTGGRRDGWPVGNIGRELPPVPNSQDYILDSYIILKFHYIQDTNLHKYLTDILLFFNHCML